MSERGDRTWLVILGMIAGAAIAAWFIQRDERLREQVRERAQSLREQAIELQTVTVGRAQQVAQQAQEKALALQAEVSAEVEKRLREGRENLDEMLERVKKEVDELQERAQRLAESAQVQAQLARKKAELRALEARKRLRELRS